MAAAVEAIRLKNAGGAEKAREERKRKKALEAEMDAHIAAGTITTKKKSEMTEEEQAYAAKLKKYKRKKEREKWPKIKGYGHISPHCGRLLPYQVECCQFYNTQFVTWSVAAVIIGNFLGIVMEKELDPYDIANQQYRSTWVFIDIFSNIVFLFELIINYYGAGPSRFWSSGWNIFDFLVVVVGMLTMTNIDLGPFAMLKIFRAFRVFRLFKRIQSLNKIIVALLGAIPGVLNAFVIMVIFMAIYAIIAVDYFRTFGGTYGNATYMTYQGNGPEGTEGTTVVEALTARGFTVGDEYYGTFSRAFYTLFQVLTGESWSEAIARPLVFGYNASNAAFVGFFFSSFILLMQIVLVNVVVAVLLDKFVSDPSEAGDEESDGESDDEADYDSAPESPQKSQVANKMMPALSPKGLAAQKGLLQGEEAKEESAKDEGLDLDRLTKDVDQLNAKVDLIMKALELVSSTGATDTTVDTTLVSGASVNTSEQSGAQAASATAEAAGTQPSDAK